MDPTSALAKTVNSEPAKGIREVVARLLGPGADELGGYIQDRLTIWRSRRWFYTVERSAEMLNAAGLRGGRLTPKALVAIGNGASLEYDASLAEKWAALLANAAEGWENGRAASFAAILGQLTPDDAQLLDALQARHVPAETSWQDPLGHARFLELEATRGADLRQFLDVRRSADAVAAPAPSGTEALAEALAGLTPPRVRIAADNLFRLGLLSDVSSAMVSRDTGLGRRGILPTAPQFFPTNDRGAVVLSDLGAAFVRACTPPDLATPGDSSSSELSAHNGVGGGATSHPA